MRDKRYRPVGFSLGLEGETHGTINSTEDSTAHEGAHLQGLDGQRGPQKKYLIFYKDDFVQEELARSAEDALRQSGLDLEMGDRFDVHEVKATTILEVGITVAMETSTNVR